MTMLTAQQAHNVVAATRRRLGNLPMTNPRGWDGGPIEAERLIRSLEQAYRR